MAALFAAMALHALLLSWSWPVHNQVVFSDARLQVELLQSARSSSTRSPSARSPLSHSPLKQHVVKPETHRLQRQQAVQAVAQTKAPQQRLSARVATATPARRVARKPASQPEIVPTTPEPAIVHAGAETKPEPATQTAHGADMSAPHAPPPQTQMHLPATLAAGVQAMLLANIHYPRQARRHGWQGAAEFQFDIDSQNIRNITMLVSTGHTILDRAARRGLSGIARVPVADGQYRLPVAFRLR